MTDDQVNVLSCVVCDVKEVVMKHAVWTVMMTTWVLSGCTVEPTIVAATPAGVTIGNVLLQGESISNATSLAQSECRKFGKDAARIPDDTADGYVQFDCVS